jgi:ADP-ribose pyrophosphatase
MFSSQRSQAVQSMDKWIKKSEQELFRRRIFSVRDVECYHPVKKVSHKFFTLQTPDWINVVARTIDDRFVMVRQHRLGTDEITIETPGGIVEEEELPATSAARELLEETGYEAGEICLMKKLSVNPAIFNNYIYYYFARDCRKVGAQALDLAEDIEVVTYTISEIMELIANGMIDHTLIVAAYHLYLFQFGAAHRDG